MIKKILIICVLFFLVANNTYALDKKIELEEARINRVEVIIERVNNIYNFVNLYILETGIIPLNITELETKYAGINTQGYNKSDIISFIASLLVLT